jgi:hypothetical protein
LIRVHSREFAAKSWPFPITAITRDDGDHGDPSPLSSRPIAERPEGGEAEWRDPDTLSFATPHQGVLTISSVFPLTRSNFYFASLASFAVNPFPLFLISDHPRNLREKRFLIHVHSRQFAAKSFPSSLSAQ